MPKYKMSIFVGGRWGKMKTIKVKKGEMYYIATYKTLDLVTQGDTKEEALLTLLDVLCATIDYAVESDNLEGIVPKKKR
jgi:hypothetical protein